MCGLTLLKSNLLSCCSSTCGRLFKWCEQLFPWLPLALCKYMQSFTVINVSMICHYREWRRHKLIRHHSLMSICLSSEARTSKLNWYDIHEWSSHIRSPRSGHLVRYHLRQLRGEFSKRIHKLSGLPLLKYSSYTITRLVCPPPSLPCNTEEHYSIVLRPHFSMYRYVKLSLEAQTTRIFNFCYGSWWWNIASCEWVKYGIDIGSDSCTIICRRSTSSGGSINWQVELHTLEIDCGLVEYWLWICSDYSAKLL